METSSSSGLSLESAFSRTQAMAGAPRLYIPPAVTSYSPEAWKDHRISGTTGSYAYGLDLPQIGMCLPGRLARPGIMDDSEELLPGFYSQSGFESLFLADGFYPVDRFCLPRDNSPALAVRFGRNFEDRPYSFLILRRDGDGRWSYKHDFGYRACGQYKQILNVDFSGNPISDPETADFRELSEFGGYYTVPFAGVPYAPRVVIAPELSQKRAPLTPFP